MKVWLCSKHKYSGQDKCPQCMEEQVMDNELRNGKKEMDEMYKDRPFIQERVFGSPQGTGRGREHLNRALIDLQESVDFLRELQSEWAWKRNTIKKNNREMAELDELVARIDRRLKEQLILQNRSV